MFFQLSRALLHWQWRLFCWMATGLLNLIRFALGSRDGAAKRNSGRTEGESSDQLGRFDERTYANGADSRHYKLYVPRKGPRDRPRALLVMLHGCTQNPDDFAAGTRMNLIADREGFLVAYPAQTAKANGMRCWNWFEPRNQLRGEGEPSLIAGITHEVMTEFAIDSRNVFIAGLSAGGAMAVIMSAVYPELFSAVGVYAGLPYRAARSLSSAFALMNGAQAASTVVDAGDVGSSFVPTIVFHGDRDKTVSIESGADVVDQAVARYALTDQPLTKTVQQRTSINGREITVTEYTDARLHPKVEYWVVHGSGHAWSGGSDQGSHTDASGPNASEEMVRFFKEQGHLRDNGKTYARGPSDRALSRTPPRQAVNSAPNKKICAV